MIQARLQRQLLGRVRKDPEGSCWNWTGQVSNSGYGRTMIPDGDGGTRMVSAQTASYLAFIGEVPDGKLVGQTCGNRLCVNPEHLQLFEPGR
jgi:hypothetical protein